MGKSIETTTLGKWLLDTSETILNAKCGIEGFIFFKVSFPKIWSIGNLFPCKFPNETNTLKLEQVNHQMAFCI